ncbi:rho GTPase-activating protein 30 [Myiozetetes cayanensis]|nr:rho GTPase-activating protein 30 [Myiozetetes cayanensis]
MSRALKARQRARRKGGARERLFGCDLREHLQGSGHDVPQVLQSCSEFVEQHGVVDGIYRLSGVSSNIQRLRQEFEAGGVPELARDIYLQDVHCVSSLAKAYCRELPNPLLTYQLYDKFADAVATQTEEARLVKIREVLKELPEPHYRTLEFLMRHLLRMAGHSARTNMHARNLAIVWAPNLLRSRDIEASGFNGTAAFMEVRVQSIVVEFILTHVEQLFGDAPLAGSESPRRSLLVPGGSLGAEKPPQLHVPGTLSQGDGPPQIRPYHTIIDLGEHRRKGSLKAKKWRSIFNLGRSGHEAKRKQGKAEEKEEKGGKVPLRPAKSMDSLSSGGHAAPGLLPNCPGKVPQRQQSLDRPLESPPEFPLEPEEPPEEPPAGESSTKSEPTTPKAPRAGPGGTPGRSRAEKCAGVHISGPFSVTVPFHITCNLSRLTRGLPCPALHRDPPAIPSGPLRDPQSHSGDAEETRLSRELRDSFAFLDSPEAWDVGTAAETPGIGDGTPGMSPEGLPALEEGLESGFMNPGEPPSEQPDSFLSIEECTDEGMDELFFLAPAGSERDSDSDDLFLSAHDELSPLGASLETPGGPPEIPEIREIPGTREIPGVPAPPGAAAPDTPTEEDPPGEGNPPRDPPGDGGRGEGAAGGASSPRTDSEVWEEDGTAREGVVVPGAESRPPIPEEPRRGESQALRASPQGLSAEEPPWAPLEPPREPPEPPVPGSVPGGPLGVTPSSPSLSTSAPELHRDPPKSLEPRGDELPKNRELSQGEPPKNLKPVRDEPPKNPELSQHKPPEILEWVQDEPPGAPEPPKPLDLIEDEPPKIPEVPRLSEPIWDESPKNPGLSQDEPPKNVALIHGGPPSPSGTPSSLEPTQDELPKSLEPPQNLDLIHGGPPSPPVTPSPLEPIQDEPPNPST